MNTPYAKLWYKESMTIGRSSPFKAYYDARNPLIINMKYRKKEEYIPIVKRGFKSHCETTLRSIFTGRFWYIVKLWQGFFFRDKLGNKEQTYTLKQHEKFYKSFSL